MPFGGKRPGVAVVAFALGLLCAMVRAAHAEPSATPVGRWLTQDGDGVIEIYPCGDLFCGRIVGMSDIVRPDGTRPVDREGHPQCGLTILRETGQPDTNMWAGRITNPDDGSAWNCEFWVEKGELHLRGYVLVPLLGQTQVWRPYAGRLGSDCKMQ